MNPLTKVKLINELNEREARLGVKDSVSWHQDYKDSAWLFLGGLPFELTEGDIICVFSQYGEVVNINLVRDKASGRSRGFCFLCYEDQRSTVLAVDNLNGIKLKGRTIRVDHVSNYRQPKDSEDIDEVTKTLREKGCGAQTPSSSSSEEPEELQKTKKHKKKKRKNESRERSGEKSVRITETIKQERADPEYDKYNPKPSADKDSTAGSQTRPAASDRYKTEERRPAGESKVRDYEERRLMGEGKAQDYEERRPVGESKARDYEERRPVGESKARDYEERRPAGEGKARDYEERRPAGESKARDYEERRWKEQKRKRER